MDERMTLEQVRDRLRNAGQATWATPNEWTCQKLADAIDAHLTRPAQAVDVESLYEVIRGIGYTTHSQARELAEAVLQHTTRAIGNAQAEG